jgi:hypothetical protein
VNHEEHEALEAHEEKPNPFFVIFDLSAVALGEGGSFVLFVVKLLLQARRFDVWR